MSNYNMNAVIDAIDARMTNDAKLSDKSRKSFEDFKNALSNEALANFIARSELKTDIFSKNVYCVLRLSQIAKFALTAIREKQFEYVEKMLLSAVAAQKADIAITRNDLKDVCSASRKISNKAFASVAVQSALNKDDATVSVQESLTFFALQALNVLSETDKRVRVNMKSFATKALLKRLNDESVATA